MKKNQNKKYSEGTIFAVPLKTKGFGIGLIGRQNKNKILGYFFDLDLDSLPNFHSLPEMEVKKAIWVAMLGDLGLKNGEWKIIGRIENFDEKIWPIPSFAYRDLLRKSLKQRDYEEDLFTYKESIVEEKTGAKLFRDGLYGYGLVEELLTDILADKSKIKLVKGFDPL